VWKETQNQRRLAGNFEAIVTSFWKVTVVTKVKNADIDIMVCFVINLLIATTTFAFIQSLYTRAPYQKEKRGPRGCEKEKRGIEGTAPSSVGAS
jgi:hypothetical protein